MIIIKNIIDNSSFVHKSYHIDDNVEIGKNTKDKITELPVSGLNLIVLHLHYLNNQHNYRYAIKD